MSTLTALLSLSATTGIVDFAQSLHELGLRLLSTGGTARLLTEAGLPVTDVAEITNFSEMLDGRVKTLHPVIHAGILARRDDTTHIDTLREHDISQIDLVIVKLYPFEKTIELPQCTLAHAIDNIDNLGLAPQWQAALN